MQQLGFSCSSRKKEEGCDLSVNRCAAKMPEKSGKGRKEEVVTREYTINLHKRLHGWYLTFFLFI
jgi:hypothetical protein